MRPIEVFARSAWFKPGRRILDGPDASPRGPRCVNPAGQEPGRRGGAGMFGCDGMEASRKGKGWTGAAGCRFSVGRQDGEARAGRARPCSRRRSERAATRRAGRRLRGSRARCSSIRNSCRRSRSELSPAEIMDTRVRRLICSLWRWAIAVANSCVISDIHRRRS